MARYAVSGVGDHEGEADQKGEKDGNTAKGWHRGAVDLAPVVRIVEEIVLFGHQDQYRDHRFGQPEADNRPENKPN